MYVCMYVWMDDELCPLRCQDSVVAGRMIVRWTGENEIDAFGALGYKKTRRIPSSNMLSSPDRYLMRDIEMAQPVMRLYERRMLV